jgi:hypothetical protein
VFPEGVGKNQLFISRQKIYSLALGYSAKESQSGLAMQRLGKIEKNGKVRNSELENW